MKILAACEESQAVCKAFRAKGHEAYSCDILPCSGGHPEWHLQMDVRYLLSQEKWDIIIAFPPCTYMTTASACRMFHKDKDGISHLDKERYEKMIDARNFFLTFYNFNGKVCIENPTPLRICGLPKPTQIIQPWQFGHPWTKRTCLWLKGLPELKPTNIVEPSNGSWVNGSADAYRKGKTVLGMSSSIDRSKTFQGIAQAMADQWG